MADNVPGSDGAILPPSSPPGGTGSFRPPPLPAARTQKKSSAGKVVVLLSSVAKPPPNPSQLIIEPSAPPDATSPARVPSAQPAKGPPPLPPRPTTADLQVKSGTMPKKITARWPVFTGTGPGTPAGTPEVKSYPAPVPQAKAPPPLPAKGGEGPKRAVRNAPIRLKSPTAKAPGGDSIFLDADTSAPTAQPEGWQQLEPGELEPLKDGLQSLDVFARSQHIETLPRPAPLPVAKIVEEPKASPAPLPAPKVAPPPLTTAPAMVVLPPIVAETAPSILTPPVVLASPATVEAPKVRRMPPPLPVTVIKRVDPPVHHAPPMVESETAAHAGKLRPPQLPHEIRKPEEAEPLLVKPAPQPDAPIAKDSPYGTEGLSISPAKGLIRKEDVPSVGSKPTDTTTTLKTSGRIITDAPSPRKITGRIITDSPPPLKTSGRIITDAPAALKTSGPIVTNSPAIEPAPQAPIATGLSPVRGAPPAARFSKVTGPITLRGTPAAGEEPKPALRPAVLPDKVIATLKAAEARAMPPPLPPIAAVPVVVSVIKPPEPAPAKSVTGLPFGKPAEPVVPEKVTVVPSVKSAETAPVAKAAALGTAKVVEVPKTTPTPEVRSAKKAPVPPTRAERAKKRKRNSFVLFYVFFFLIVALLAFVGFNSSLETRLEGQVIPPAGMLVANEVWIVNDFRNSISGVAEDLAAERTPALQEIQERQEHVQRVQADIALREERMHLLQGQIQASRDELAGIGRQTKEASQHIWDGLGAQIDAEYDSRLAELQNAIASRAKTLHLNYQPDDSYHSAEVWANAYRLALYDVPANVDSVKEHQWLGDQLKQWRDFLKSVDARKEQLREKAAQIKTAPAPKIAEVNQKLDDLQRRIDTTQAEEDPLKAELQQAELELSQTQATEASLDEKYYKQLKALPRGSVIDRLSLQSNGRFSWPEIAKLPFVNGETEHTYRTFSRATRPDGREYWSLGQFSVTKNQLTGIIIEPDSFVSIKAYLRPDLPPDEQDQ